MSTEGAAVVRRWARGAAVLATLLGAGCTLPNALPAMSMSRYVRAPASGETQEERGRVRASTGIAVVGGEQDSGDPAEEPSTSTVLYMFPAEGGLSLWLHDMYDLSLSVGPNYQLSIEGNVAPLRTENVRLGIVHGANLGLMAELQDDDGSAPEGSFYYGLSAGVVLQVDATPTGVFFAGARYTWSSLDTFGPDASDDPLVYTHYVTGSVGYMLRLGRLALIPEILAGWGMQRASQDGQDERIGTYWLIVPTITVAADF